MKPKPSKLQKWGASTGATSEEVLDRLQLAQHECLDLVASREKDILRCLGQGLAWSHPNVVTHRARYAAALAELDMLELLIGDES